MKFIPYSCAGAELRAEAFDLYVSSFPVHERRSESCHNSALSNADFIADVVVCDDEMLQAILFYWRSGAMIYVEHIAVNPRLRGQNIGSRILTRFIEQNVGATIILEIDPPVDDVAERRLRFYSHLGFELNPYAYTHPSYCVGGFVHELVLLSYGRVLERSEFDEFVDYMRCRVLQYVD